MSVQFDLYESLCFRNASFRDRSQGVKKLLEERDALDSDDKYLRRNDPEKS